jgi:hypothetical protein
VRAFLFWEFSILDLRLPIPKGMFLEVVSPAWVIAGLEIQI